MKKLKIPPIDPEVLRTLVHTDQVTGKLSNELAAMLVLLVKNYAQCAQFKYNPLREDMEGAAIERLFKCWTKPDVSLGTSLFSYFTSCCYHEFIKVMKSEADRKQKEAEYALKLASKVEESDPYAESLETIQKED